MKTCAACGRKGSRGFAMSGYYTEEIKGCIYHHPEYVCESGPACDRRCRQQGWTIYG